MRAAYSLVVALLLGPVPLAYAQLQPGDVVFQDSGSSQSAIIREVTRSPWSHVGVVVPHRGRLEVLEASGTVRWTAFPDWRARARGAVLVRRSRRPLRASDVAALVRVAATLEGRPYDARFEWGDRRIYCSELVYLLYERALGRRLVTPQRWRELRLGPRGEALARRRLGRTPHPNARVVTPAALAEAASLVTVAAPRGTMHRWSMDTERARPKTGRSSWSPSAGGSSASSRPAGR